MRVNKLLTSLALASLLVIPTVMANKITNVHADYLPVKRSRLTSLPKSYSGTWGAQKVYGPLTTRSRKDPVFAKIYRRTGFFENNGTNTRHAFEKAKNIDPSVKGYENLFMRHHKWYSVQGGDGINLSRNRHTMYYMLGNDHWSMHRINNKTYNYELHQAILHRKHWRKVRRHRIGKKKRFNRKSHRHTVKKSIRHTIKRHRPSQQQRYISQYKRTYGMTPTVAHNSYNTDELSQIKSDRQEYHYLLNHEDNADVSKSDYDQEVVDWINFFRTYIYTLSPVSEDDSYNQKAQSDLDDNIDPEDDDTGKEPDVVEGYFTDANNADDNGTAGHRDSVLDESADLVGIGRSSSDNNGNSLYFNFGLDNGAARMKHTGISYPCGSVFPLADAKNAQYWSFQIYNRPYSNEGISYPTPNIEVHDDTSDEDVPVSDITMVPNEVYYAVDTHMLKANHQYTITLTGRGVGYNGTKSITTTLFNM